MEQKVKLPYDDVRTVLRRVSSTLRQQERPTMSAQEAPDQLGISKPTLLRLWSQGHIAGYRVTPYRNGHIRLYRDAVEKFDRQRKNQAPMKPSDT